MSTPNHLKYVDSHEWIALDADQKIATIGITEHAQESIGDITFVELPQVGDTLSKDDIFGVVESVKSASDLYAPITGEVVEVNEALEDEPERINDSPYEEGWIMKIKIEDASELDDLLDAEGYKATI